MARQFTPEDAAPLRAVSDPQISPDGTTVAYVAGDSFTASGKDAAKLSCTSIYLASPGSERPARLTSGPRSDTTPRWSPDGRTLAFLSDRQKDGERQVHLPTV